MAIVHWELRESMKEAEVEIILQRAKEKHPEAAPRIISDNGPQFVARDFIHRTPRRALGPRPYGSWRSRRRWSGMAP